MAAGDFYILRTIFFWTKNHRKNLNVTTVTKSNVHIISSHKVPIKVFNLLRNFHLLLLFNFESINFAFFFEEFQNKDSLMLK